MPTFMITGPIRPSADTAANWAAENPILPEGEMVRETDTGFIKFGDGVRRYLELPHSGLGAVSSEMFNTLRDELIAARGDRSSLDLRIEAVSRYSSPCVGSLPSGEVLDGSRTAVSPTTITGSANAVRLVPFTTSRPFVAGAIGARVTAAAAAGATRYVVYGSDANGWPGALVFEGGEDLSSAAIGAVFHADAGIAFDADRVYWLGVRYNGTATTLAAIASTAVPNLGLIGGMNGTAYAGFIQRVVPFADPAPPHWGFVASERVAGSPPAIRLQVA